jgi:hypothetical protein
MRRVRIAAWAILLALAALQSWAGRFLISPDGVSYLDISDAVVDGRWSELLNPYWSPLYPALIGVLRLALRPTVYWEFGVFHLANLLLFAVALRAFEYFLDGASRSAAGWRTARRELESPGGRASAYAFFGAMTLVMTPLGLTTPDVAVSASVLASLGAMIRLRGDEESTRSALLLGVALGTASLTKAFMIPWSVVCLTAVIVTTRGSVRRDVIRLSAACWIVVAGAWSIALSRSVGRPTFGDTGRLTYVWYVNQRFSPSEITMPPATTDSGIDSVFEGIGVLRTVSAGSAAGAPEGTNPIWYDPARWYAGVTAEFKLRQQAAVLDFLTFQTAASLGPLVLLLAVLVSIPPPRARRVAAARAAPVAIPALLGIGGYALVLMTTRYIVAFVIAIAVAVWLAFPWPSRVAPRRLALGLALGLALVLRSADAGVTGTTLAAMLVAILIGWALKDAPRRRRVGVAVIAGLLTRFLLIGTPTIARAACLAAGLLLVLTSVVAVRDMEPARFSRFLRVWLHTGTAVLLLWISTVRFIGSVRPAVGTPASADPNSAVSIARNLVSAGLEPGMRLAIVGSPFDAYWARALRAQFVVIVPPSRSTAFWTLPDSTREALVKTFAAAGAEAIVVTSAPSDVAADSTWRSVYRGGVRLLRAR